MELRSCVRMLSGALAAGALLLAPSCSRQPKEMRELAEKIGKLDELEQQAKKSGSEQAQQLKQAGVGTMRPSQDTLQLSEEQRRYLETRIREEKDSSYRQLLQDVMDRDKTISELNDKMAKLRQSLPKPDTSHAGDSHYSLAIRFLRKRGVPEKEARRLVSRVNIMEKLVPGFEIYHFYSGGTYGTWVNQGKAKISPAELIQREREKIEGERDTALAQNEKLQEEVDDLATQKAKLTSDVEGLRTERASLIAERNVLQADNAAQLSKLNSLHYVVGSRQKLQADGVIIVPVFSKDRAGKNWRNEVFSKSLDLRTNDTLIFSAKELGLPKIRKVSVVPGSYLPEEHYKLTLSEDRQTATIKLLAKERFKNDKVVFAVTD